MTDREFLQEIVELLKRFADLQLEYAEICELQARESYLRLADLNQ